MKTALTLALLLIALNALTGCMLSQASTRLEIERDGLSVKYSSPKDQHLEYDPETGKILVKSTSNEALVNAAGIEQAQALNKTANVMEILAEKVK